MNRLPNETMLSTQQFFLTFPLFRQRNPATSFLGAHEARAKE